MKIITRQMLANTILKRFHSGYIKHHPGKYEKLKELFTNYPAPNPDDVDNIIGNTSWTHTTCNECGKTSSIAIQLGDEPDYESATVWMCKDCIKKAYIMMKECKG